MPYIVEPALQSSGQYVVEPVSQDVAAAQKAADLDSAQKSMALRSIVQSAFPLAGQYAPDLMYGMSQVPAALAEMGAKLFGDGSGVQRANQSAKDFYENTFRPDLVPGASVATGAGQQLAVPVGPGMAGAGLIKSALTGAGLGAGAGALTPNYGGDDFWSQKLDQVKTSAELGAAGGVAGNMLGRVISPNVSDAVKLLRDENVGLTPPQAAGGVAKGLEDLAAGFPLVKEVIGSARFRGITDFNRAMYARALTPFGEEGAKVAAGADVGYEGVAAAKDFIQGKYQSSLANTATNLSDPKFQSAMTDLAQMAQSLPPDKQAQFASIFKGEVLRRATPSGLMNGESMKAADSELGKASWAMMRSQDYDTRKLGDAVGQMQDNLRDLVATQNPDTAPIVRAADKGYSTLKQIMRAASYVGADDGIFTPSQLLGAIKATSAQSRFATGTALNQDLASAGKKVLPSKMPDSGTAGRFAPFLLAEHADKLLDPMVLAGAGLAAAPYSKWLSPFVTSALTSRPQQLQTLGDLVKQIAPALAFPAVAASQ